MHPLEFDLVRERQQAYLREAEQARQAKMAREDLKRWPLHRAASFKIGALLEKWGRQLTDYGACGGLYVHVSSPQEE